jgi:DNA-directed RNA polymerase subunit M/transcription elongation factor TFIIS
MPRSPEDRIGQIFGRWRIIAENERSVAIDHGKERLKTRNFKVECTQCGYIKNATYKNIYYDSINHPCKTEYEKSFDGIMYGKSGVNLVGIDVSNYRGLKFKVLSVRIPKPGEYPKFKTLVYKLECPTCKTKKDVIHHQVINKDHSICNCWKTLPKEQPKTREQIIKEIDDEFNWMLELNKQGQLINYLKNKFPDENWKEILEENYG